MLRWSLPDPDRALAAVRLQQHAGLDRAAVGFARDGDEWVLEVPRPPIDRIEYQLELHWADGRVETVPDPGNPLPGGRGFRQPSVLELPEYRAPAWLDAEPRGVDPGRPERPRAARAPGRAGAAVLAGRRRAR